MAKKKPVLLIQHAPTEHPAVLKRTLDALGIAHHWIHPYRGDRYPEISEISGIISLGGPMGANDDREHTWINDELELLRTAVEGMRPTVGICLGGQLMARALGSRVEKNSHPEVGWFQIRLTEEGKKDPVLGHSGMSPWVYQWHYDTFHLPVGATHLANSPHCDRQAFRIGNHAYGFQFHPEADHQLVHEWLAARGVEEELEAESLQLGPHVVHTASHQRTSSFTGERSNLIIATGITELFSTESYEAKDSSLLQNLIHWTAQKTLLTFEILDSRGRPIHLKGTVTGILALHTGEYAIFREENGILWPIRLDRILKTHLG